MKITSTSTKHRLHVILRTRIYHLSLLTKNHTRIFECFWEGSFDRWATRDAAREHGTSREGPVDPNFGIHGGGKKDLGRSNRWGKKVVNPQGIFCFGFKAGIFWKKIGEVDDWSPFNHPEMVQLWKNCVLMRVWWFRCSENWSSPLFAPLIAAWVLWGVCFRQLGAVQGMLRSPNQICLDLGKFQVNELLRCQEESITYQPKLGWNAAACSLFGDCDEGLVERCWKLACDTVKFDGKDGTRCESSM